MSEKDFEEKVNQALSSPMAKLLPSELRVLLLDMAKTLDWHELKIRALQINEQKTRMQLLINTAPADPGNYSGENNDFGNQQFTRTRED